ncbi:MAG: two pore domain potassium channel family protein [Deltaproteobacteria bacterium]|nr:two pore domain potassium channel family protein [Candidatus Zymogenaceae bacterium]
MISFLLTLVNFVRSIVNGLKDPEFRGLFITLLVTLLIGSLFYHRAEGWSLLDSLYFSVITLSTVGYGDLAPTKIGSKIFTIMYIFMGIGILLGFVDKMFRVRYQKSTETKKAAGAETSHQTVKETPAPGRPHTESNGEGDSADTPKK